MRQNFCSSTFAMLFAFQPTRACIFDISAHQNVWLRSALRSLQLYGNSLFCDRLRLFAICNRLRLYGNQPLDRTWFYLLRSSAITIAGSQTIAEVFPYDRRPYCDLRSAIIWKPAFMFYLLRSSAIVCDHDRRIADDRRSMFPYDRRRSQTLLRSAICDPRSYGNQP